MVKPEQNSHRNRNSGGGLGLPEILKILQYEKKIATVSTKLEPSLKKYLQSNGGSSLIRELILQALVQRQEQ